MALQRNSLSLFTDSVNKLIECKLIMVDGNIANLLKSVARVPALTSCIAETLKASSYVTEFSRARVSWTRPDGTSETRLKLPADSHKLFTFVVCLLMEVDSGKRNFIEFLREYYYDKDSNISYSHFVNQVLKPFKRAGESILRNVDPDSLNAEDLQRAENFFAAERMYIGTEVLIQLLDAVENVRCALDTVKFVSEQQRLECLTMCNAMTNVLHLKNPRMLRIIWIGFKNTLGVYATFRPAVESIGETMRTNGLI